MNSNLEVLYWKIYDFFWFKNCEIFVKLISFINDSFIFYLKRINLLVFYFDMIWIFD